MKISIVSPVYLGQYLVQDLVKRLENTLSSICDTYEIILVEDGSPDESWESIEKACLTSKNVKGIKLSRNFGQHYAITAGLNSAKGEWIIVMDCDLQDKPEEIPKLFNKTQEGFDIVYAKRELRQDNAIKKVSSKIFYKTFGYLTDSKQDSSIANFGIYHHKVIESILSMKDHVRFFPTMVQWVGFKSTKINVSHGLREEGKSSYSWKKLINLAFDNIISFSDKPLRLTVRLGLIISIISFLSGIFYLFRYFNGEIKVLGFASIVISIWFLSGLIIFTLGIIGIYLGKTFDRVKDRPTYIISKKVNL
ncbi:glycosyltransferase family 2 protein [Aquimarina sp. 2201CG5-10]|uniref:glycosyltransferase family 2 protein n=1 Tax=Aquimarina callyspongiae TaxID=3098150 RepID=UPI002AB42C90|nr:glycosyltransferase family 2 protein [Aquimarina sp. 2201CG5-10]MDY8138639.1 glycosyltransferase family 2 protein [Aquimarina sp. 2201CG5-10]